MPYCNTASQSQNEKQNRNGEISGRTEKKKRRRILAFYNHVLPGLVHPPPCLRLKKKKKKRRRRVVFSSPFEAPLPCPKPKFNNTGVSYGAD